MATEIIFGNHKSLHNAINKGTIQPYVGCTILLCYKKVSADKPYGYQPSTHYSIYCSTETYDGDVFLTLDTQYFQLNL